MLRGQGCSQKLTCARLVYVRMYMCTYCDMKFVLVQSFTDENRCVTHGDVTSTGCAIDQNPTIQKHSALCAYSQQSCATFPAKAPVRL